MKVILLDDIPKLGRRGEVRDVAEGYARNYLLPHRLVLPASPQNLKQIEQIKAFALSTAAGQGFANMPLCNPCAGAAPFGPAPPNFNTIPGYPEYSRTVTIANGPTVTTRLVRVQVQYRRVTAQSVLTGGQQVDFTTLIAQH